MSLTTSLACRYLAIIGACNEAMAWGGMTTRRSGETFFEGQLQPKWCSKVQEETLWRARIRPEHKRQRSHDLEHERELPVPWTTDSVSQAWPTVCNFWLDEGVLPILLPPAQPHPSPPENQRNDPISCQVGAPAAIMIMCSTWRCAFVSLQILNLSFFFRVGPSHA